MLTKADRISKNFYKAFLVILMLQLCINISKAQNSYRPCRLNDSLNTDILFLGLGNPGYNRIKQGDFDLANDKIINTGKVIDKDYYKENLGIKYFKPIDKTNFKLPATGWCSWYYYYQNLDMEQMLINTKWLAKNFNNYGLKYIQVDDAWQSKGTGDRDNRDWTTINKRFSDYGMDSLAIFIKKNGFEPAIWIVPHGQSNIDVAEKSGAFMLDKYNKSTMKPGWAWVGDYQLDPTKKSIYPYFKQLFNSFKAYNYFKIDGQSLILPDYINNQKNFFNPKTDPIVAYRNSLNAMRESVGDNKFLLGCWRTPVEGIGYFNGSRSNGDIWGGLPGFASVLEAIRTGYFLHNTAWYVDPDPIMVGQPLTLDMAKMWASTIALTGMSTFCTEKMDDLPAERVDILKKVFPAEDIYPIDIFRYSKNKTIYDLKINKNNLNYDVVGILNYEANQPSTTFLDWGKLGLEKESYYHIYDFWKQEYVGCFNYGFFSNLEPASCNVYAIVKANGKPQLISTNRHITQGAVDIIEAVLVKDIVNGKEVLKYRGKSHVIANDEYKLVFGMPLNNQGYKISKAGFSGENGKIFNSKGCSFATFVPDSSKIINWEITFEPVKIFNNLTPGDFREKLKLTQIADGKLRFDFEKSYGICFGFLLAKNGKPLGYSTSPSIFLSKTYADKNAEYTATEVNNNFLLTDTKFSTIDTAQTQFLNPKINDIDDQSDVCYAPFNTTVTSKGKISFYANGSKTYTLNGKYKTIKASVCVNNPYTHYLTKATLQILANGKTIYQGKIMDKTNPKSFVNLNIANTQELTFKVIFVQAESDWGSLVVDDIEIK